MRGVRYEWDESIDKFRNFEHKPQIGFVAQEIAQLLPEAVIQTKDGYLSINYNSVIPILAEGIKEQQNTIEELKLEINELKIKLDQTNSTNQIQNSKEYFQIIPNPVEQESKVVYKLDNATTKAMFIVYDLQGKMLKQMDLPRGTKEGQIALNKTDLGKGMYILSLIINGNEAQSKRFLVL